MNYSDVDHSAVLETSGIFSFFIHSDGVVKTSNEVQRGLNKKNKCQENVKNSKVCTEIKMIKSNKKENIITLRDANVAFLCSEQ